MTPSKINKAIARLQEAIGLLEEFSSEIRESEKQGKRVLNDVIKAKKKPTPEVVAAKVDALKVKPTKSRSKQDLPEDEPVAEDPMEGLTALERRRLEAKMRKIKLAAFKFDNGIKGER